MSINGDKGSNYNFDDNLDVAKPLSSGFNLSYVNSFTCEEAKAYPVFYEYLVGGDTGKVSQQSLCRVLNTPVVPLASRQRMFYHTFMSSLGSLWAEAETFFTKGRTVADAKSLAQKSVPTVSLANSCFARGKLMDMLGFVNIDATSVGRTSVPIFKPMMYLRIWRDNYINQRIYATWLEWKAENKDVGDNVDYAFIKSWMFPADDHEFRWNSKVFDQWFNDEDTTDTIKNATFDYLFGDLKYRWWTDDYFTTAQITPIYGDVPYFASTLEGTFKALSVPTGVTFGNPDNLSVSEGSDSKRYLSMYVGGVTDQSNTSITNAMNSTMKVVGSTDITLDSLRNLACATSIMLKLAKTDGSYGQYGLTYFGVKPHLAQDMKAKYIGGSYQPIAFTEVVNTGANQGDISGRGISAGKETLGTYFSDDYSIIMTIMSIMPDTYYSQGWHRQDLFTVSDDFYVPEKASLGMEAVLKDEIFYDPTGNAIAPVFGYQNRCDYMRYRYNEVHGKVADSSNESYRPYIEQRFFDSCPTLTPSFLSMDGTVEAAWRTDKTDGVSYFVQVLNEHTCRRPLPYKAEPNNLGF